MYINIKDKLAEKKMNRNQFAKAVGIGYPAARALYDGTTTKIEFSTLDSVCRVLDCTPNDILVSNDETVQKRLLAYTKAIAKLYNNK